MKSGEPAATGSTPTSTSTRSRVHLRAVAQGHLHPSARCSLCGSRSSPLEVTLILWTHAPGPVCKDNVACVRRRYQRVAA
jgi:hypothetical protein